MIKCKYIYLLILTCALIHSSAQVKIFSFKKELNGANFDEKTKILEDAEGNLIVAGSNSATDPGGEDFYLAKLSPDGTIYWEKSYGYKYNGTTEDLCDMISIGNSFYLFGGGEYESNDAVPKAMKVNSDGQIIFDSVYHQKPGDWSELRSVCYNEKENVFMGMSTGYINGNWNVEKLYLQKFQPDGKILRKAFLTTSSYKTTGWGNIFWDKPRNGYMSIQSYNYLVFLPLDSFGNPLQSKEPYISQQGYVSRSYDAIQLRNGNYIVVADLKIDTVVFPIMGCYAMAFTSSGDTLFTKRLTDRDAIEDSITSFTCIAECSDGGFILGGTKLRRTDSLFNTIWEKTLDYNVTLCSVIQTHDGGYAGAGTTGGAKIFAMKTDSTGFITGMNENVHLIKSQIQIYPNPTSDLLHISSDKLKHYGFELIDISGKTIFSSDLYKEITLDTKQYSSGVYFLKFRGENNDPATFMKIIIAK